MGYAKHVGRVGALAFALGIGIGLAGAPGIACADDGVGVSEPPKANTSVDSSNDSQQDSTGVGESQQAHEADEPGDAATPDEENPDPESELGPVDDEVEPEDPSGQVTEEAEPGPPALPATPEVAKNDAHPPADSDRRRDNLDAAIETSIAGDADIPDVQVDLDAEPVAVSIPSEPAPAPVVVSDIAPVIDPVPVGRPSAQVQSIGLPTVTATGTGSPADAPITSTAMFVMAASTRRELASPNTPPTASLAYLFAPSLFTGKVFGDIYGKDADRDSLTYTVSSPTKGSVTVNRNGNFVYTPTAAARHRAASATATATDRVDTFTVSVSDGKGGTAQVTVSVQVKPANARPNVYSRVGQPNPADGVVTGAVKTIDRDGDVLTYRGPTATSKGTVVINSDGSFRYTPTPAARADARNIFRRVDSFTVTVDDGHGGTDTTRVYVKIAPPSSNSAPHNGSATLDAADADGVVTGTLHAVDDNGDTLTYGGTTSTDDGSVEVTAAGRFTYRPSDSARLAAATTPKDFTFAATVSDGRGGSATFEVDVPISPLQLSGEQPATGTVTVPNPSGGALVYEVDDDSEKGTATVDASGSWTYTPTPQARHQAAAESGGTGDKLHTFAVSVTDSQGNVTVVPITVGIAPANEIPETVAQPEQAPDTATGVTTGVLTVTDADGDPLTVNIAVDPAQGTMHYDIDTGAWSFEATPEARHAAAAVQNGPAPQSMARGFATFAALADPADPTVAIVTFTFRDGYGGVQVIPLEVQISPANEEPVITRVTGGNPNSSTGTITGTVVFTDSDDDPPTFGTLTSMWGVNVVIDPATGAWSYTPTPAVRQAASSRTATIDNRVDTFTIIADDGHGGVATIDVTVPVLFSVRVDGTLALTGTGTGAPVVSADGTRVYIATGGTSSSAPRNYALTVIDTTTKTGYLVPLNAAPTQPIIISANGSRAFATVDDTVYVIDTATGTSRTVTLPGTGYHSIVATPDGSHAYAASEISNGYAVTAIDAITGAAQNITPPGTLLIDMKITADGAHAYVHTGDADGTANTLTIIDTATNAVDSVALPDHIWNYVTVSADGSRAYALAAYQFDDDVDDDNVPEYGTDLRYELVVIDTDTGQSQGLQFFDQGEVPSLVSYGPDGRYAYVVTSAPGGIFNFLRIDTVEQTGSGSSVRGTPSGAWLSADGTRGHIASTQYDAASGTWKSYLLTSDPDGSRRITLPANTLAGDMIFSPDGTFAYATGFTPAGDGFEYSLRVIETTSGFTQDIPVSGVLYPMALSDDGTRLIGRTIETVSGITRHSVVVVDTVTETVTSTVLQGNIIDDKVALSPDRSRAYVVTWDTQHGATAYMVNTVAVPTPALPSSGVIGGIENPSGGPVTYTVNDDGSRGTAAVNEDGNWTFTPNIEAAHRASADGATAADKQHTFTVTVTDSDGNVTVVTLTAGITPANDAPVLGDSEQIIDPDTGIATGVLTVSDADGDPLTVDIDVDPRLGTLSYDIVTGTWIFEPTTEARHAAAATAAPTGPTGPSDPSDPVDPSDPTGPADPEDPTDPEVPTEPDDHPDDSEAPDDDPQDSGPDDSGGSGGSSGGSGGSSSDSGASSGARMFAASAAAPDPKTATVVFTFSDGHGGVQVRTVQVQISPANADPVVVAEIDGGEPDLVTGTVTGSIAVTDDDNDEVTYSVVSAKGAVVTVDSATRTWRYTPTDDLRRGSDLEDTVTFTVDDGHGGIVSANLTVSIAPALEVVGTQGYPNHSLVVGSTGYGYQFVTLTDTDTTVIVVTPGGVRTVAGTVTGMPSGDYEQEGPAPILRSDGGIVFSTVENRGSFRVVSVTTDGTLTVEYTGSEGRWLHAGDGTHYFVGVAETDEGEVVTRVLRFAADGTVQTHVTESELDLGQGAQNVAVGPNSALYVAINASVPNTAYADRAALWVISPSGVESTYAMTSLTGTNLTDLSFPSGVTVTAGGTAYLTGVTVGLQGSTPVQAAAVLVVDANGAPHRVDLPGAGVGDNIVAAGNYGVIVSGDGTTEWISVIDSSGSIVNHQIAGVTGTFVTAADGSGAYAPTHDGVFYVNADGTLSTLSVGSHDDFIVAGPDGSVYLRNSADGTLITIKAGVVSTAPVDSDASFADGSYQFAPDGTLFFLLNDHVSVRVAIPSAGVTSPPLTLFGFHQAQLRFVGDTAVVTAIGESGVKILGLDTDGTVLFNRTFQGGDGPPTGDVEVAPDGTAYVTVFEEVANVPSTQIWAVDSAGAHQVFSMAAYPAGAWKPSAKTAVLRADGKLLVSVTVPDDELEVLTKVYVVDPATVV